MANYMLTTIDNPFNPFTQFSEWFSYDCEKGYNTCQLLARVCNSTPNLGKNFEEQDIDDAMNEIVDVFSPLYFKIGEKDNVSLPISTVPDIMEVTA